MKFSIVYLMVIMLISFSISPAQTNWIASSSGTTKSFASVSWNNGLLVASGTSGTLLTSSNGQTWISHSLSYNRIVPYLTSSAWSGSQFVLVSSNLDYYTSENGSTWTLQANTNDLAYPYSIIWADTQFVAVGYNGRISTSPQTVKWSIRYQNASEWLYSVASSGSLYATVGRGGTILTSPDGISWTKQTSGYSDWLMSVVWTGTQFVAVGGSQLGSSAVLTSPDGIVWTTRSCSAGKQLFSVTWTGTMLVAVGQSGTVVTSPDGITWKTEVSGTTQFLRSVISTDSILVAVGDGGVIQTSILDNGTKDIRPVPILPLNGSLNTSLPIFFSWHGCSNALAYQIEISTEEEFREIVTDTSLISDTLSTIEGLATGTNYYWRVRAHCMGGVSRWSVTSSFSTEMHNTGIISQSNVLENTLSLNPSPFNPLTQLRFVLNHATHVELTVHDANGKLVSTLVNGALSAGQHTVSWSGSGMASGVYVFRLKVGNKVETKRAVLMR